MGKCDGCGDPSIPTVNNEAKECCELTPANCVVTSEYQPFFKIGVGKTLTFVIDTIAKFVKALTLRVDDIDQQIADIEQQIEDIKPYKVYSAFIFQGGGAVAPTATVFENTLSGNIVWTYTAAGDYLGTLAGEFTPGQTWLIGRNQNSVQDVYISENNINSVQIFTDSGTDGNVAFNIEIRVYNP